jgi:thiol-disulfide isomerase/thioredoxin
MDSLKFAVFLALLFLVPTAFSETALLADQNSSLEEVPMYLFWQVSCSHCEELKPFISDLEEKYPRLDVKRFEISKSQEGSDLFDEMAKAYGRKAKVTPTVFVGDYMIEGYNGWITEGRIESALINCTEKKCPAPEEKIAEYQNKQVTTTTVSLTTSTTTSSTTTTMSTSTTTSSTTTSSTTSTTSTTTTLPAVEKSAESPLIPGALIVLFIILIFAALRCRRDKGAGKI